MAVVLQLSVEIKNSEMQPSPKKEMSPIKELEIPEEKVEVEENNVKFVIKKVKNKK